MQNLWLLMHFSPNSMPTIFANNRIAVFLGVALNGVTNIAKGRAGLYSPYPYPHCLIGFIDQTLGCRSHVTDHVHFAGVSDKSALLQRDINVDNITGFQLLSG